MSRSSQSLRWHQQDTAMKDLTNDTNNISYTDGNTIPQVSRFHEVFFDQPKNIDSSKLNRYQENKTNNSYIFQQNTNTDELPTNPTSRFLATPQIQIFQKPSFTSPVQLSKRIEDANKIPKEQFHQDGNIQQIQQQQYNHISSARLFNDQQTRQREASFGAGSHSFVQIPDIIINPPQQHQQTHNNMVSQLHTQLIRIKEEQLISQQQSDKKPLGRLPSQRRFEDALRKYEMIQQQLQSSKNQNYQDNKRNNLDRSQSPQRSVTDALKMIIMANESDTQNGQINYQSYLQLCQQLGLQQGDTSVQQLWNLLLQCYPLGSGSTVSTQLVYQIFQVIFDQDQYSSELALKVIKRLCGKCRRMVEVNGSQRKDGGDEDVEDKEDIVLASFIEPNMIDNLRQNLLSKDWMNIQFQGNNQTKKDSGRSQKHGQKQFEQSQKKIPMIRQIQQRQSPSKEVQQQHTQRSQNDNSSDGLTHKIAQSTYDLRQHGRNITNSHYNPPPDMSNMFLDSARTTQREHYLQENSVHRRLFGDAEQKIDKLAEYQAEKEKVMAAKQMEQCTFKPQINKNTQKFLARSKSSMIRQTTPLRDTSNTSRKSPRGQQVNEASVCEAVKGASETVRRMEAARKIKQEREQFWEKERIKYDERNKKKERLRDFTPRDLQKGSVNDNKSLDKSGRDVNDNNNNNGRGTQRTLSDNRMRNSINKPENTQNSQQLNTTRDNNQKDNQIPPKSNSLLQFNLANNTQLSLSTPHRQPTPRKITSSSQSSNRSLTPARDTKLFFSRHGNPMLYVDVNISKNRSCKIPLYEGDLPETIAEEFGLIYKLSKKQTERLIDKLAAVLEQFYGGGDEQQKK